jgi:hypothetical protein
MSWTEIQEVDGGVTIDVGGVGAEIKVTEAPKPKKVKIKAVSLDPVNSPSHYRVGGIETIDFIEAKDLGYNLGNVVKYITRAHHKGELLQDLKKAQWYLNREVGKLEEK